MRVGTSSQPSYVTSPAYFHEQVTNWLQIVQEGRVAGLGRKPGAVEHGLDLLRAADEVERLNVRAADGGEALERPPMSAENCYARE